MAGRTSTSTSRAGSRPASGESRRDSPSCGRPTTRGETWDFGDGTPLVSVRSDANAKPLTPGGYAETVHRYDKPGHDLVRVERAGPGGAGTVARLQVRIGEGPDE